MTRAMAARGVDLGFVPLNDSFIAQSAVAGGISS